MDLIFFGIALICIGIVFGLVMALHSAGSGASRLPAQLDWIDEISVDRYQPMLRLLSRDDLLFLRQQPGYDRQKEFQLRTQRVKLFTDYLRHLKSDFSRTCAALKVLMVQAERDRPDLAAAVLRAEFAFARGVLAARLEAQLYRFGIGNVDAAGLLNVFSSMQAELRSLVPADGAALG